MIVQPGTHPSNVFLQAIEENFMALSLASEHASFNKILNQARVASGERLEFYNIKNIILSGNSAIHKQAEEYLQHMESNLRTVVMVTTRPLLPHPTNPDKVIVKSSPLRERSVSYNYALCNNLPYGDQPSAHSAGTGFFITPEMIATAAHVLRYPMNSLDTVHFIQGICIGNENNYVDGIEVFKSQVFKPSQNDLLPGQYHWSEFGSDFALVKVKPAFEAAKTTTIDTVVLPNIEEYNNRFKDNAVGTELYSIGHGLGLPIKVSYEGKIIAAPPTFPYYDSNLSLVGGSSGSPVFNAETHELWGIYMRGTKKPTLAGEGNCLLVKSEAGQFIKIDGRQVEGQECQRLEVVWAAMQWMQEQS